MQQFAVYPRDPLISRDGRPFGPDTGNKMYSLPWVSPSVVAGSFRTMMGKTVSDKRNPFGDKKLLKEIKSIEVYGAIPYFNGQVYLPRPRDFLRGQKSCHGENAKIEKMYPKEIPSQWGTNLPHKRLWPVIPSLDEKPDLGKDLWPLKMLSEWLVCSNVKDFNFIEESTREFPQIDERVHVVIDRETMTAEDQKLFVTQGLDFNSTEENGMLINVKLPENDRWQKVLEKERLIHPLGGERRLALWEVISNDYWKMPDNIYQKLKETNKIVMYIATPAYFRHGWLPAWLSKSDLVGKIPNTDIEVQLKGAIVGRWQAISGWSYKYGAPKQVRRLVPPGSMYFFHVLNGDPAQLSKMWLMPISDSERETRSGFGLACYGVW